MIWLIAAGLVMGAGTLGVASWAEQERTAVVAHTMGLVTFSLSTLFFSITTRDERRTAFSRLGSLESRVEFVLNFQHDA